MRLSIAEPEAFIVATEPLTEHSSGWQEIPANHMLKVDRNLHYSIEKI
jgi:predicted glutamine amidotransferase